MSYIIPLTIGFCDNHLTTIGDSHSAVISRNAGKRVFCTRASRALLAAIVNCVCGAYRELCNDSDGATTIFHVNYMLEYTAYAFTLVQQLLAKNYDVQVKNFDENVHRELILCRTVL